MAICSSGTQLLSFFRNHAFLISLYLLLSSVSAADNITANQSIKEGQTLTSPNGIFQLGFFNPTTGSNSRYLGIWHDDPNYKSTVWVANRENPISDSFGTFTFSNDGNLVILDGTNRAVWTTNASGVSNETHVQLLDSGNLILREGTSPGSGRILWESFSNPSSALLPGMKIGINLQTKQTQVLRSWTSFDDPAPGIFSFGADPQKPDQFFIWRRSVPYWRSYYLNGSVTKVVPYLSQPANWILNLSIVKGKEEVYFTYSSYKKSNMFKNLYLSPFGRLEYYEEYNSGSASSMVLSGREEQCSGPHCGANTICNDNNKPLCRCLSGFGPLARHDWNKRMNRFGLGGCIRRRRLQCNDQDKFVLLRMQFPDPNPSYVVRSTEACREVCQGNCACNAFTYYANKTNSGNCAIWEGDIKQLLESAEEDELSDIYIKVAPDEKRKWLIPVVIMTVITGSIMSVIFIFMFRRRAIRRAKNFRKLRLVEDGNKDVDIPYFELANIVAATNDFADSNKLGQGGFGPVYKGKFTGGQEIAVKRLSKSSCQGFEEFKNEVILIAKLQHRNLVRLLGYCFDGDEKMLLYEYMPNKSLDFFIFDKNRGKLLDWRKRFTIILGIARGLLYLHQDSRLRIIHRDLKTSNVLLDEEMNPKISDFGLARIFGGNQTEENTNRVVGTYGYMSPEYASHGLFSVKSDVFSFGVILVEIITGQKNTSFFQLEGSFTLLGHAWQLWKEDKALDLIDPSIRETCDTQEVLKCLHVGLLCVQEDAGERPDMATVVAFFVNQTTMLPTPNKPAFFIKSDSNEDYNQNSAIVCSKNEVTMSSIVGR